MAGLTPYKAGQGYWTRIFSAIGFGAVIAYTAKWVGDELSTVATGENAPIYRGAGALGVVLIGGVIVYWLVYVKRRSSEFLIATEGEMRKVNWSTRREVVGSTWVVIAMSLIIALILFIADLVFQAFFGAIGVLESG
jgi:preprotein translocase subunit SecE